MQGGRTAVSAHRRKGVLIVGGLAAAAAAAFAFALARPSTAAGPARLEVLEPAVDVQSAGSPDFGPGRSDTELAAGSVIRTDDVGLAELDYADGSLSRIGPNSTYEVKTLQVEGGRRQIVGNLEVGQTFHRVSKVTGSGSRFEVHTGRAVAAVRGTAFAVQCRVAGICEVGVSEGSVNVRGADGSEANVRAGRQVSVSASGAVGPLERLSLSDPWIAQNIDQHEIDAITTPTSAPSSERPASTGTTVAAPPPAEDSPSDPGEPEPEPAPVRRTAAPAPRPSSAESSRTAPTPTATSSPPAAPPVSSPADDEPTESDPPSTPTATTPAPVTSTTAPAVTTTTVPAVTTTTVAAPTTTTTAPVDTTPDPEPTTTTAPENGRPTTTTTTTTTPPSRPSTRATVPTTTTTTTTTTTPPQGPSDNDDPVTPPSTSPPGTAPPTSPAPTSPPASDPSPTIPPSTAPAPTTPPTTSPAPPTTSPPPPTTRPRQEEGPECPEASPGAGGSPNCGRGRNRA